MPHWWDLAFEWRKESAGIGHGAVEARIGKFAEEKSVHPLTVRRAAMVLRLVEAWAEAKRIVDASALKDAPISHLLALQRIDRFDPEAVDKLLPPLIAGKVDRSEVLKAERDSRTSPAPARPRGVAIPVELVDLHRRRMDGPAFNARAKKALLLPGSPMVGGRLHEESLPCPVPALSMDAMVTVGKGRRQIRHGVRFIAAAGDVVAQRRAAQTLLFGLAAARYVDRFWAFVERPDEAEHLRALAGQLAPCGVGVLSLNNDGQVNVRLAATRLGRPDLSGFYDTPPPPDRFSADGAGAEKTARPETGDLFTQQLEADKPVFSKSGLSRTS